jgi:DNA-directed RNA polymerase subunit RPC12/RpoP
MNKEGKMQLQLNYTCDICEETIHLDFEKSFEEKKLECPHCGVVYDFSEDDLAKFNECYKNFVQKMKDSKKEIPA